MYLATGELLANSRLFGVSDADALVLTRRAAWIQGVKDHKIPIPTPDRSRDLNEKELRCLSEYFECDNFSEAARRVGLTVWQMKKLHNNPKAQAEIKRINSDALARAGITAERIARELASIAFLDPGELFDEQGKPIPFKDLPSEVRRAVGEVTHNNLTHETKIKAIDKKAALKMLGDWKEVNMFQDNMKVEVTDTAPTVRKEDLESRAKTLLRDRFSPKDKA